MIENDAEIRRTVLARDAFRREAHLPPLNIEEEVSKGCKLAASKAASELYDEQCQRYASDRQRIRDEIIAEMRSGGNLTFPHGWAGNYHLSTLVEKRFQSFLLNGVGDAK